MKLAQLASKPQLVQITIDDENIVEKYNESIDFWIYDRQDMDTYMRLAQIEENNFANISVIIRDLVMDDNGKPMLDKDDHLPMDVMIKMVELVVQQLGNSASQTSAA